MALHQRTTQLKLRDDDWKTLGASRVQAGSVVCPDGLREGQDCEIDYHLGRVRRLRDLSDRFEERHLFTFSFTHDDRTAEFAAVNQKRQADLAVIKSRAQADPAFAALARLLGAEV